MRYELIVEHVAIRVSLANALSMICYVGHSPVVVVSPDHFISTYHNESIRSLR
jgi:hypothetical protein